MVEAPGTGETLPCELPAVAAGFPGPETCVPEAFGAQLSARSNRETDRYQTVLPDIFACGGCRTGQSLVEKAMVDGREYARAVDRHLSSRI